MTFLRRQFDALRSALVKRAGLLRVLALVGSAILLTASVPNPAEACGISLSGLGECVALIIIKFFQLLVALMGWLLVLEVDALIRVAQYHGFVSPGPSAVLVGWVVTRDLANMFFIVILLVIAFGTILGSSTYHYEKNLPRLLIMAVVINFSKTICGIFIDMGQVVMLTFVNGFKEAAGGNFVKAFQISSFLNLGDNAPQTFGMAVAMLFAFILTAVAACVILVMFVIMTFRIVMLWVLIILSPIAFLASAVPNGGSYYADWWKEFKKYIITGPIIAFFLWLALASVQKVGDAGLSSQGFGDSSTASTSEAASASSVGGEKIPTQAGASSNIIMNMVIAISILFAGLKFAGESGVVGAGFAKTVRGKIESTGRAVAAYGGKRLAQPFMTGGGKVLAKIPLVGGLGRALTLKGESWKKERQASAEKFAGTPEDMARLSPGAFNRNLKSLSSKGNPDAIDKKRLDTMVRAGLADPTMAARMGKDGTGVDSLNQLIVNSKGKSLQDAVGLMMTDKNVNKWAKDPEDPELLRSAYAKLQEEAKTDPNMKKTVGEFEAKFAPQLMNNGLMDKSKLREVVPKMAAEDIADIDNKKDMAMLMGLMNGGQFKKILSDGKPKQIEALRDTFKDMDAAAVEKQLTDKGVSSSDLKDDHTLALFENKDVAAWSLKKTRGDAKGRADLMANPVRAKQLTDASRATFDTAMKGEKYEFTDDKGKKREGYKVDPAKVTSALVDAISLGQVSADEIKGDVVLQGMIGNRMNTGDLAKSVSRSSSPEALGAAQQVMAQVMAANPEKAKNMRRQDQYQDILPTQAMVDAAGGEERKAEAKEALTEAAATQAKALGGFGAALSEAKKELMALESLATAPGESTEGSQAAHSQLQNAIKDLERAGSANSRAQKEKQTIEVRIKNAPANDTAGIAALNKSLSETEKTLKKTQQEIIKGMGALKGGGKA